MALENEHLDQLAQEFFASLQHNGTDLLHAWIDGDSQEHDTYFASLVGTTIIGHLVHGNGADSVEAEILSSLDVVGLVALANVEAPDQQDIEALAGKLDELILA